ncbi:MAG: hypothetical protein L0387_37275 [Acidobacteria bacterium]|nr:hypothetical protein [Acidobacteriota bacterium]
MESAVQYKESAFHVSYPADSGIVKVGSQQGTALLSVWARNPNRSKYYYPDEHAILTTYDGAKTWHVKHAEITDIPSPLAISGSSFAQAPSSPSTLYKFLDDVGLYLRSVDGGNTWALPRHSLEGASREAFAAKKTGSDSYYLEFRIAAVHPVDSATLYATIRVRPWNVTSQTELPELPMQGLYESHDGGETWARFTAALDAQSDGSTSLGISPVNPRLMYGLNSRGIVKSVDGGQNWAVAGEQAWLLSPALDSNGKPLVLNGGPTRLQISQFLMDPQDENVVYAVSNKGVYRTTDGGLSWRLLDLGFDEVGSINSMGVNPSNPDEIFVGTRYGVFRSPDRGCRFDRIYPTKDSGRVAGGPHLPPLADVGLLGGWLVAHVRAVPSALTWEHGPLRPSELSRKFSLTAPQHCMLLCSCIY